MSYLKMTESNKIEKIEHLALESNHSLIEFCSKFVQALKLPELIFDYENETEWGEITFKGIKYNVSKPYKKGILNQWDSSVPINCNFGISLSFSKETDEEFNSERILDQTGNQLSRKFNTEVFYHRTWFRTDKNEKRNTIFKP
jgi:hypothetical protein